MNSPFEINPDNLPFGNELPIVANAKEVVSFGSLKKTGEISHRYQEVLAKRRSGIKSHVDTGLKSIDEALPCLLDETNLIILAARPAMGKTALGQQIGENVANAGRTVCFYSLEMSETQVIERSIVRNTGISMLQLREPQNLSLTNTEKLNDAINIFNNLPLLIDESPKSIDEIVVSVKENALKIAEDGMPKLGLILVDYLTIVSPSTKSKGSTRELEVSDICRKLKALAKSQKVPVLCLAQLNRSVEARINKRPMMSDLRESGSIEQEADTILFIYRDDMYNPESAEKGIAEIYAGKNRSFGIGGVKMKFVGEKMKFTETDEIEKVEAAKYKKASQSLKVEGYENATDW